MFDTGKALTQRLDELSISAEELSAMVRRPLSDIEDWQAAKIIGGEAAVLLRVLADAAGAERRAAQARRTVTTNLEGDGAKYAGIESPPYGSNDVGKVTGGVGA